MKRLKDFTEEDFDKALGITEEIEADEGKTCPVCNNPDVPVVTTKIKGNYEVTFATREYRCDCCDWRSASWEEEV